MATIAEDVVAITLGGQEAATLANSLVPLITAMAKSYTRNHGFTGDVPEPDIAAVIAMASCRAFANPRQEIGAEAWGPFSHTRQSAGFTGWTLAEQIVLNRYRARAQ